MRARISVGGTTLSATGVPAQRLGLAPRSRCALTIAGLLAAGCAGLSNRGARLETQTIKFDSCTIGKAPAGFSTALTGEGGPGSWVVRQDPTSPGARRILVQESADETSYRFPLCIYEQAEARDVAVEVSYKALSGKVDQAGGIILRYTPGNYYIARANALEDNVILFKTVQGKRSKIQEVPVKVTAGEWHKLRFEAKGRRLTISFDGKQVIDTSDDTFVNPGKVGLWTKADSVSAFADLNIEPAR